MDSEENYIEILVSYIRHYRVLASLTQKDVGNYVDITEQRFASIEKNKHKTNIKKCLKIAECLNTKVDDLYRIVKITKSQYNIIKGITLNNTFSEQLIVAFDTMEKYNAGEIQLTKGEENDLLMFIRNNSILRYGDVLESHQFENAMTYIEQLT